MDELDKNILSELQNKGFQKSNTLASLLGVGERTLRRRIRNMRNKGIIKIVAVPNPVSFGYRGWAKIGIRTAPGYLQDVASQLVQCPSVYFVAYSIGTFNIMIAANFRSVDRLAHFANSELTKIKGVQSVETMILICPRKYYHFSWPTPIFQDAQNQVDYHSNVIASGSHYKVNEVERKIVSILMEDGLARPATLKSRLGMGENTIRKYTKNMLNKGVFKIEVVPNTEVLEYEAWATMGIVINNQLAHEVLDNIIGHPAVYLASTSLGRFNLVIAARFENMDLLNQFVNIDLPAIEGVSSVETFLHKKPLKYHNINWLEPVNSLGQTNPADSIKDKR
jgi:DNA-binding Lrp family transcriptional regulator